MKELKRTIIEWWYKIDSIELVLFAAIWASIGFMIYHTVVGVYGRFFH